MKIEAAAVLIDIYLIMNELITVSLVSPGLLTITLLLKFVQ